jgi:hypothetical protein
MNFKNPYLISFGFLFLLWVLYRIFAGSWNPLKVVVGEDGRPSTSKLQMWMWTVVVLFTYGAIYAARAVTGKFDAINDIPANVLIAMGLSVITATAAKGITVSFIQSGELAKTQATTSTSGPSQVLREDDGSLDLSKIQMLAWTVVAIAVYLINVVAKIKGGVYEPFPDIDAALMVLMGLGQGAYLGKKLVSTDTPRVPAVPPQP